MSKQITVSPDFLAHAAGYIAASLDAAYGGAGGLTLLKAIDQALTDASAPEQAPADGEAVKDPE
jgi:hypothetical protein